MSEPDAEREFLLENSRDIAAMGADQSLRDLSLAWNVASARYRYSYHFTALGRPIIQLPQDVLAVQEIIWEVRPDLIVETGVAHGGSLILNASMLALLDYCDAVDRGAVLDPRSSTRRVVGIDIDIRPHNRRAIEEHPMSHLITMFEGSSIDADVVQDVSRIADGAETVLVLLDSNHTHEHVLAELEAYAPLTTRGSYCVVFDTVVEDLPDDMFPDRPWGKGDNPKTAAREYLRRLRSVGRTARDGGSLSFEVDESLENKLMISVAPHGYLRRVS